MKRMPNITNHQRNANQNTVRYHFILVRMTFIKNATWRRKWQPTPVFLPGKVHGQRSLVGCSPWGYMTEHVYMRVEGDGLVAIN